MCKYMTIPNQVSDLCKNCNPHSSYHTTAVGECLVHIWFAEICQLTMCVFGSQSMLSKSTRRFVWIYSQLLIHTMLYSVCMSGDHKWLSSWYYHTLMWCGACHCLPVEVVKLQIGDSSGGTHMLRYRVPSSIWGCAPKWVTCSPKIL